MRSLLLRGILFVVVWFLACIPSLAQSPSDSAAPPGSDLIVRLASPEQPDFDRCGIAGFPGKTNVLGLNLRYVGQKPLRGYVVAVRYQDSANPIFTLHQASSKLIRPGEPMIMPGAEWHSTVCGLTKDADVNNVSAVPDLIMYEDGSTAGPAGLRESNHLDGVSVGMNFAAGNDAVERAYVTATPGITGEPLPKDDRSSPLEFSASVEREDSGQALLVVEATNRGAVPVIGYDYTISFSDHVTGAFVKDVTTKALETRGNAADYLQAGATWASGGRNLPTSSDGALDTYEVTLDTVVLADGTVLGPRRSRESDELVGMIEGIGMVKSGKNGEQPVALHLAAAKPQ